MLQGEHAAILPTFFKLPFVIKIFVLSIFEWLFYTGFTVTEYMENVLKFRKLFSLFSNKMLVFRAAIHKMLDTIANREDPDQGLHFLSRSLGSFFQAASV